MACSLGSDGNKSSALIVKNRENHNPFVPEEKPMDFLYMNGPEVFKFAVKTVPKSILKTLNEAELTPRGCRFIPASSGKSKN